jgi:hypothetical protein
MNRKGTVPLRTALEKMGKKTPQWVHPIIG